MTDTNLRQCGLLPYSFRATADIPSHWSNHPCWPSCTFDPQKLDEVVIHFPGEQAVAEAYFSRAQSVQTLIATADALVSF